MSAQSGLSLFWSETPVFEARSRRNLLNPKRGSMHTAFHYQRFIVLIWLNTVERDEKTQVIHLS